MHIIKMSDVIVNDRQRKEYDIEQISRLADSIQEAGLLHAPRIESLDNPVLIAGGCRLRAIKILQGRGHPVRYNGTVLQLGEIPVSVHHTTDTYEVQVAELYENIHRTDLSWKERVAAVDALHQLRRERNPAQTTTQTAKEIFGEEFHSSSASKVTQDVRLAQAMRDDPEIASAKSRKDAEKILRKRAVNQAYSFLASASKAREEAGEGPFRPHKLIHGDAQDVLEQMPEGGFTCILTDPPYGIGANTFGDQGQGKHNYNDSEEYVLNLLHKLAEHGFRVTEERAHAYVFCDPRWFFRLKDIFEAWGWYVWQTPLIWYKGNQGLLPRPDYGPRRTYECILYAIKGDRRTLLVGQHDVISIPGVGAARHAAEKPVDLYVNLLKRSCNPGDNVLDPFAGSGTIFPAATRCDLKAVGINLSDEDYNLALSRIEEQ